MAMKEDKIEWKNRVFLLAKEKSVLDLKLNSKEAQERAFVAHVDHLKAEVRDLKAQIAKINATTTTTTMSRTNNSTEGATTTTIHSGSSDTTRGTGGSGSGSGDGGGSASNGLSDARRKGSVNGSQPSTNGEVDVGALIVDSLQTPLHHHHQHRERQLTRDAQAGVEIASDANGGGPRDDQSGRSTLPSAGELTEALRREANLKARVDELVTTLEKLTRNSEARHQQSADFVDDLKRANAALVAAFEKAKKKHVGKVKKMEAQIQAMSERHESVVDVLKQRIALLEEEGEEEEDYDETEM